MIFINPQIYILHIFVKSVESLEPSYFHFAKTKIEQNQFRMESADAEHFNTYAVILFQQTLFQIRFFILKRMC